MNLSGKRVKLRAIEISDLQFLKDMINDPRIEEMVVGWSFPISDHEQKEWIMKQMNDEKNIRLIVENEYEEKIGLISLTNIDWKNRSAVHGIKISNKNFKNQGYGAEAVKTIVNYAFNELNLNRITASWLSYNIASRKLHLKCGWRIEGELKNAVFKKGIYNDITVAGLLKSYNRNDQNEEVNE